MSPFDFGKNFLEEQVLVSKNLEQRVISQNFTIEELLSHLDLLAKGLNEPEILALIEEMDKLNLPPNIKEHTKQLLFQHHQTKVMNKMSSSLSSQAEPSRDSDIHVYDEWVDDDRAYDIGDWYENRTFSATVEENVESKDNGIVRLSEDLSEFSQDPKESPSSYTPTYEGIQVVLPDTQLADELGIVKYNVDRSLSQDTFPYQYVTSIVEKLKKKSIEQKQIKEMLDEGETFESQSNKMEGNQEKLSLEASEEITGQVMPDPPEGEGVEDNLPISMNQVLTEEDILPENILSSSLKEAQVSEESAHQEPILEEQATEESLTEIDKPITSLKEEKFIYSSSPEGEANKQEDYVMEEEGKVPAEQNLEVLEVKEDDNAIAQVTDLRDDTEVPSQLEYKEIMEEDLERLNTMSFDTPSSLSQKKIIDKENLEEPEDSSSEEDMEKISELSKHLEEEVHLSNEHNEQMGMLSSSMSEDTTPMSHPKKYWWEDIPTIEYQTTQDFGTFILYRDLG